MKYFSFYKNWNSTEILELNSSSSGRVKQFNLIIIKNVDFQMKLCNLDGFDILIRHNHSNDENFNEFLLPTFCYVLLLIYIVCTQTLLTIKLWNNYKVSSNLSN